MLPSCRRSSRFIPRPMYFLPTETTRRRFADVSCSRASRPMLTTTPRRSRSFVPGGPDQVEGGRSHEQVTGRLVGDGVADHRVCLGPVQQTELRLGRSSLVLGVVERPLVERDDPLPWRLSQLLAELDCPVSYTHLRAHETDSYLVC